MPVLHQMQMSGNCYKVRLAAQQLGVPLTLREYPLFGGAIRSPEFLAKNPNGRVPLLEWEDGRVLPESNAISWHVWIAARAGRQLVTCRSAVVDVLRTV